MTAGIEAACLVVAGLNAVSGVLGSWIWYREESADGRRVRAFWLALRVGQASAVLLAVAVGVLVASGKHPQENLFYLYALLPLAVAFVAEQLRVASAQTILDQSGLPDSASVGRLPEDDQRTLVGSILRREIGVMAISAVVVVFLALRAAGTAHGF